MNFSVLIDMKKLLLVSAVVLLIYGFGYHTADKEWELKYKEFQIKSEQEYSKLLKEKIDADEATRKRVSAIQKDFTKAIENQKVTYEKVITDLHNNFHPNGVYYCPSNGDCLSRADNDPNGLVCYRRTELRERIAKSMALAKKADELALKYNALVEIVKGEQK